ncbi:MAG: AAA family ATPase [Gammaproteobacteria bacterium]|nr:AAA family ATPase [Gammaproteobacteria bacterium]
MYDQESEEIIIMSALLTKQSLHKVVEMKVDDFYFQKNRIVFTALQELYSNNIQCDSVNLRNRLKNNGVYDKVGDDYFVNTCTTVTTSFIQEVIDRVIELSKKRQIADLAIKLNDHTKSASASEILDIAEKSLREINETRTNDLGDMSEFTNADSLVISENYVKSGFRHLDSVIGGFFEGEFIIVGARTSVGKSAFALNIAQNVAKAGKKVLMFSLEMSREELAIRMVTGQTGIQFKKIRTGLLNDKEKAEVDKATSSLYADMPGLRISTKTKKVDDVINRVKKAHDLGLADMVIIDYLQLLDVTKKNENRRLDIGEMTRKLKTCAGELEIPIMCLSQLSRAVESRVDKTPMLSDLRESGDIEQDASTVILLGGEKEESKRDIIIAKCRNGEIGAFQMEFINHRMLFRDYSDYKKYDEV